jgi:hypothetical protein
MTDDLDRLLRSELQSAARDFEPGHPDGSVGLALSARLRRRRRRRNAAGTVAVFAVVAGMALFVKLATPPTQTLVATGRTPPASSLTVATPGDRQAGSDHAGGSGCATSCPHPPYSQGSSEPGGRSGDTSTKAKPPGAYNTGGGPLVPPSTPSVGGTPPTPTTAATEPPTTTDTSTPTPPTTIDPRTFVFTLQDSSRTVEVSVGDTVVIRLSGCAGTKWTTPTSSAPDVLLSENGSPTPAAGGFTASFLATSSGRSQLAASITVSPCAVSIEHFTLIVVVGQ